MTFPPTCDIIETFMRTANPSPFGKGGETVLDAGYRNAREFKVCSRPTKTLHIPSSGADSAMIQPALTSIATALCSVVRFDRCRRHSS